MNLRWKFRFRGRRRSPWSPVDVAISVEVVLGVPLDALQVPKEEDLTLGIRECTVNLHVELIKVRTGGFQPDAGKPKSCLTRGSLLRPGLTSMLIPSDVMNMHVPDSLIFL